jgi:tetratricopeptide (TPR) repeat protein
VWNDEGLAAARRGDYKEAESLFRNAMDRWRALGPEHDAHYAVTEQNLARIQCSQGLRMECQKSLEDSLDILRRTLGSRDEHTLTNLNLLAGVALALENAGYAANLLNEALPIEREHYPHSICLSQGLGTYAVLLTRQLKLKDAFLFGEEALTLTLEIAGEYNVEAALNYSIVAEIHRLDGRSDRALPLFRKSRDIYEKLFGKEHPRVGMLLSQEGLLLLDDRKYALAEHTLLRARQIMDKKCPDCGYEQSMTLYSLGLLRSRQGRLQEAEKLLTRALAIQEQYMQRPGPAMGATLETLADVLRRERRFAEAERFQGRAFLILAHD